MRTEEDEFKVFLFHLLQHNSGSIQKIMTYVLD